MYEYRGLQYIYFMMLYGGVTLLAVVACMYLLFRQRNVFADDVKSSLRLRRWTAALLAAIAASHLWWYAIGLYWLADDRLVRNITNIMLDHTTLEPLTMAVLLAMLQDRRRPLWPWLMAQLPVVIFAVVGIAQHSQFYGYELPYYWQLAVIAAFVTLERKEVWQSLAAVMVLLMVYMIYTSNAGELLREYLSQIISIVIIVFLVWRVETLQELDSEEDEPEDKGIDP